MFSLSFRHFSTIVITSEIFNPHPLSGIERPDAKLFMSITGDMISQWDTLVPWYKAGLDAVARLLLKAAPSDDLYNYLRDHPLQNPAKAKVHCDHGFAFLRWAVKIYLKVSLHSVSLPTYVLIPS